jgi:hypothetical protein
MVVRTLGLQLAGVALYAMILLLSAWQRREAMAVSRG